MPNYSLPKMQNQSTNNPQPPPRETLHQAPTRQAPQHPNPIDQLGEMSQKRKMETENALLREALAMSAQNCETLMKQLVESQTEFQRQVREEITIWQQNHMSMSNSMKQRLEEMSATIGQHNQSNQKLISHHSQNHQSQLSKIENMNEVFSKSLNDVLTSVGSQLIAQVRADTDTAFEANNETMQTIIQAMQTTSNGLANSVKGFTKNLDGEFKKSNSKLDNYISRFNKSVENLFKLNTKEKWLFYLGIFGGIATPAVLLIIELAHALDYWISRWWG